MHWFVIRHSIIRHSLLSLGHFSMNWASFVIEAMIALMTLRCSTLDSSCSPGADELSFAPLFTDRLSDATHDSTRSEIATGRSACAGQRGDRGTGARDHRSQARTRSARLRHARAIGTDSMLFPTLDRTHLPRLWNDHGLGSRTARRPPASSFGEPGRDAAMRCRAGRRALAARYSDCRAVAGGSSDAGAVALGRHGVAGRRTVGLAPTLVVRVTGEANHENQY